MSDQSSGKWWQGVLAVIGIGVAGYFIYLGTRSPADNVPQINMSREEVMKSAMVDGIPATEQVKVDTKEPRTATPEKTLLDSLNFVG